MSFTDVVTDLKHHLDNRIKSPFTGAFTLGLLIRNWDLLILTFTGTVAPIERVKQVLVHSGLETDAGLVLNRFLVFPACFTLTYFLVFPLLNALFLWLSLQTQRLMLWVKYKVEPGMYLSIEESNKQRKRERKFRAEAQTYIVEKDKEIEAIQEELEKITGYWEASKFTSENLSNALPVILDSATDASYKFEPELEVQIKDSIQRLEEGLGNLKNRGGSFEIVYDLKIAIRIADYIKPHVRNFSFHHEQMGKDIKLVIST